MAEPDTYSNENENELFSDYQKRRSMTTIILSNINRIRSTFESSEDMKANDMNNFTFLYKLKYMWMKKIDDF